jgi:hypothetical protein
MGGITLEDFTESVAYREIFGLGEARGVALGQAQGEAKVTLRQLSRRCGPLSAQQESLIRQPTAPAAGVLGRSPARF